MTPPSRSEASKRASSASGKSSVSRCAAASPLMPPPTIAIRARLPGGDVGVGISTLLPHVPAGVPGPIRLRPRSEAPFQAAHQRQIVERGNAAIAKREVIGELKAGRTPMVDLVFD